MRAAILAAAAAIAFTPPAQAAVNLIQDGNFDNPAAPGNFVTYSNGQSFGGWTVTGDSVDLIGSYWGAPVGGGSVDLAGNKAGGITQTIAAPVGAYNLSFYLAGNPDGGDAVKNMRLTLLSGVNIDTFNFSFDTTGLSKGAMGYVLENLSFVSHGDPITLQFESLGGDTAYGAVIGGINLTSAVPEPASWAMLLIGFGGIGMAMRSRRRAAARSIA
jgi:choice-of-anchor C domain-containing protein